jgi:uncharacterized membrane protein YhaH (DUF805 family)
MSLKCWFSFSGRMDRFQYWRYTIATMVASVVVVGLDFLLSFIVAETANDLVTPVVGGLSLIPTVSYFAAAVRRVHDRNKNAAWAVLYTAPGPALLQLGSYANTIEGQPHLGSQLIELAGFGFVVWWIVALGMLPGTRGPNRYGPDPARPMAGTPVFD